MQVAVKGFRKLTGQEVAPAIKPANSGKTENDAHSAAVISQLGDALHIPIAEKLGGLRQVRDAVGIESMSRAQVKSAATGSSDITIRTS